MIKIRLNLRKAVAIATCLAGFSVSNVLAQNDTTDQGVVINGVKWATRNVDNPGTFTANPEDYGMLYQWNRKIGLSAANPMVNSNGSTTWDNTTSTGTTWEKANDPCPIGWRVPTHAELQKLFTSGSVWTTVNGVKGRKFGSENNTVFLPAVGNRRDSDGKLFYAGKYGVYWSSTPLKGGEKYAHCLSFKKIFVIFGFGYIRGGYSVRCVCE